MFSTSPSVRPSVCYQTCEHDMLKRKEPVLMKNGTRSPRSTLEIKRSTGQGSRSYKVEDRFGGLVEPLFLTDESSSFIVVKCCMVTYFVSCAVSEIIIIIIIISKTMFIMLSSRQSHCKSSPSSFDECRSGRRPKTKPDELGCESACTGCQSLHPPSPFIIITQPES